MGLQRGVSYRTSEDMERLLDTLGWHGGGLLALFAAVASANDLRGAVLEGWHYFAALHQLASMDGSDEDEGSGLDSDRWGGVARDLRTGAAAHIRNDLGRVMWTSRPGVTTMRGRGGTTVGFVREYIPITWQGVGRVTSDGSSTRVRWLNEESAVLRRGTGTGGGGIGRLTKLEITQYTPSGGESGTAPGGQAMIQVHVEGNRYCDRVRRPHRSNQIMLQFDSYSGLLTQRCWDAECRADAVYQWPVFQAPEVLRLR